MWAVVIREEARRRDMQREAKGKPRRGFFGKEKRAQRVP
jgi:hypothetical protein